MKIKRKIVYSLILASAMIGFNPGANAAQRVFYMSPTGSDKNDGRSTDKPFRSFAKALRKMDGGDELILMDGTYSADQKNGTIHYNGRYSDQIPSGKTGGEKTIVRSQHRGKVIVKGQLFIGRSFRKDHDIRIDGITFEGGGHLYNTENVDILNCGFHGAFVIGTNDHEMGNSHDLVEDSWIWADEERIIAANYRSDYNVWRRVVVRGDGCALLNCIGPGNPNVGITVYDSNHVSMQNVIVVDRILGLGYPYSDFAAAQHTPGRYLFGMNEWLGTISVKAPDSGYYMEPDDEGTINKTITIRNAVAWKPKYSGVNIARSGTDNLLENITVIDAGFDGIRVGKRLRVGVLRNSVSVGARRYGVNSAYGSSFMNSFESEVENYHERYGRCIKNCMSFNPLVGTKNLSLKYVTRIESKSRLSKAGEGGVDIGANVLFRYGKDGSHYGEEGFDQLTTVSLWPWKNEDIIKRQMCRDTDRGFCSSKKRLDGVSPITLTSYIWELLGHRMPNSIYESKSR